jgi:hypothetical protein
MANLRGQIIDISPETRDNNICDMQERAAAEELPIPYPWWFDGTSVTRPLIERTRSPFPISPIVAITQVGSMSEVLGVQDTIEPLVQRLMIGPSFGHT